MGLRFSPIPINLDGNSCWWHRFDDVGKIFKHNQRDPRTGDKRLYPIKNGERVLFARRVKLHDIRRLSFEKTIFAIPVRSNILVLSWNPSKRRILRWGRENHRTSFTHVIGSLRLDGAYRLLRNSAWYGRY